MHLSTPDFALGESGATRSLPGGKASDIVKLLPQPGNVQGFGGGPL